MRLASEVRPVALPILPSQIEGSTSKLGVKTARHVVTTMEDWKQRLEQFLTMNDYKTMESAGTVSQEEAREKAYGEYDKFKVIQDRTFVSDFDKFNGESVSGSDTPLLPFDINPKDD